MTRFILSSVMVFLTAVEFGLSDSAPVALVFAKTVNLLCFAYFAQGLADQIKG